MGKNHNSFAPDGKETHCFSAASEGVSVGDDWADLEQLQAEFVLREMKKQTLEKQKLHLLVHLMPLRMIGNVFLQGYSDWTLLRVHLDSLLM